MVSHRKWPGSSSKNRGQECLRLWKPWPGIRARESLFRRASGSTCAGRNGRRNIRGCRVALRDLRLRTGVSARSCLSAPSSSRRATGRGRELPERWRAAQQPPAPRGSGGCRSRGKRPRSGLSYSRLPMGLRARLEFGGTKDGSDQRSGT